MDYEEKAKKYENDIIQAIKRVVAFKSVKAEESAGCPFGKNAALALKEALKIGEELGYKTVNLDNYAGYIEMGDGEKLIGILAHVDVVSEGEGWNTDPYTAEVIDGAIYGRGVCDDKGPAMIALYAMKLVEESGIALNKRVRLVLGANEETGMLGIKHYKEVIPEEFDYGFTPDADFPLIFGEKGSCHAVFSRKLSGGGEVFLKSISGGEAVNVVCPKCIAVLGGEGSALEEVSERFEKFYNENTLSGCTINSDGELTLVLTGVGAHASMPELGKNSISYMMKFLGEIIDDSFINGYNSLIGLDYNGRNCGAYCEDEFGMLTFNIGMISTEGDTVKATIDIRYPITVDFKPYEKTMSERFRSAGFDYITENIGPSLYIDPESDLVKTLYSAYVEATGDDTVKPYTIGGGTYAKSFKNMIAFGPEFPGSSNNIHMANEHMTLADMENAVKIYALAIEKLLKL